MPEPTTSTSAYVQTEPNPEPPIAPTQPAPTTNGVHSHPVNAVVAPLESVIKVVHTQLPAVPEPVTIISPSTEYADDISLLTDPNVLRETELITIKEQCSQLTEANQELTLRLGQLSSRSDSVPINGSNVWIFAILIAIIACLLGLLFF